MSKWVRREKIVRLRPSSTDRLARHVSKAGRKVMSGIWKSSIPGQNRRAEGPQSGGPHYQEKKKKRKRKKRKKRRRKRKNERSGVGNLPGGGG
jgi:hypothetical protein